MHNLSNFEFSFINYTATISYFAKKLALLGSKRNTGSYTSFYTSNKALS